MTNRLEISDAEWGVLFPIIATHPKTRVGNETACRRFLIAVLWILRSGSQWRLLPAHLGHWNSVFKRFSRWNCDGVWEEIHKCCCHLPDLQAVFIDHPSFLELPRVPWGEIQKKDFCPRKARKGTKVGG
jgi:transposase